MSNKFRAGLLFAVYDQSNDPMALEESVRLYRNAREHWSALANTAATVYKKDVSAGELSHLRGHWLDRLPAMDEDIAEMIRMQKAVKSLMKRPANVDAAISTCRVKSKPLVITAHHSPPKKFTSGSDIKLEISFSKKPFAVILHYRHIDHAERYNSIEMTIDGVNKYVVTIPGAYTESVYPLTYYFEVKESAKISALYPGLGAKLKDQPYFIMRQTN